MIFRDKKNDNTTQFTIVNSEELKCLLTTEIPTVVIKPLTLDTNLNLINIHSNPRLCPIRIKTLRYDMGRIDQVCRYCEAKFWMLEKKQNSGLAAPKFFVCCAILACTSFGAKVDQQFVEQEGNSPAFAQLYIYDTAYEIQNRHNTMNQLNELSEDILQTLQNVLDKSNPYIQKFHQ
ncbi:9388_t:CDS:2, partial [Dentiscutata erythropus]